MNASNNNIEPGKQTDNNSSDNSEKQLPGGGTEITNNDGSVLETLDTAFHGKPGFHEGENISGSDRANYYEARSDGKNESEEELDVLRDNNKE